MGKGHLVIMGPIYVRELDSNDRIGPIYDSELDADNRMGPIYDSELDADDWMGPIYDSELDADYRMGPIYDSELDSYHKRYYNMMEKCPNQDKNLCLQVLFQCFSALKISNLLYNYMKQNGR